MYLNLFGENEKYAPKMKEKAFQSILNKKFPGGACPQTPLAAWALQAQVTRPKGVYIGVTPVTTKATAVQNSTENPGFESGARLHRKRKPSILCLCGQPSTANQKSVYSRAVEICGERAESSRFGHTQRLGHIPKNHHVSQLVVKHYHVQVHH